MEQQKYFASMHEVVMKKSELIEKLIKNKAKHDIVLETAIAGYWEMAAEKLELKRSELLKNMNEFSEAVHRNIDKLKKTVEAKEPLLGVIIDSQLRLGVNLNLDLVYPQDHSNDYERAIRMMGSSIYDEVKLSADEYDAYVLNNWEWKKNFIAQNTGYVNAMRLKGIDGLKSRTSAGSNVSSEYASLYDESTKNSISLISCSGMAAF